MVNVRLKVIEMKRTSVLILLIVLAAGSVWSQNKVLSLDGDGDYVEVPYDPKFKIVEQITLECWVKVNNETSNYDRIIAKHWDTHTDPWLIFGLVRVENTNKLGFQITIDSNVQKLVESPTDVFQNDIWVHVAGVYDGSNIFLYADGLEIYKEEFPNRSIASNSTNIIIGANNLEEQMREDLNAFVDEARIWNIARTEVEIQASMNSSLTGKENGLVGYWNFDDQKAKDLVANGNDGEFKGDAKVVDSDLVLDVSIPDPNLRAALEKSLGKNEGDAITKEDLAGLEELSIQQLELTDSQKIRDLSGLEYSQNLEKLIITDTLISDISILTKLNNLIHLDLTNNQISDIKPLSSLTNLTNLILTYNYKINDMSSLANLTNLVELSLYGNKISNIEPVSNLTNLTDLSLGQNKIGDISAVANLTNLTRLQLESNHLISDISSLTNLTKLSYLSLGSNQISDISVLADLTNLGQLRLFQNKISDIAPLLEDTRRSDLTIRLQNNPLSNTALSNHIPELQSQRYQC